MTHDLTETAAVPAAGASANYLTASRGALSWFFSLDHKRIGVMYLASMLVFFIVGGALGLMLRFELVTAAGDLVDTDSYNRLFTMHGAIMVFLVLGALIPATLGNFLTPLMIGAENVAFPRLNLFSYHLYLLGGLCLLYSVLAGSIDTGWTFHVPYEASVPTAIVAATLGVLILAVSCALTSLNLVVTLHTRRAPTLGWDRLPLFVGALYVSAIVQLLVTPILAGAALLLVAERLLSLGIIDPALGGDPVLFQHLFWFYAHAALVVTVLPGLGIMGDVMAVHGRTHPYRPTAVRRAYVWFAALSLLAWGQHLIVGGQSELASVLSSAFAVAAMIPAAVPIVSALATLRRSARRLTAPMLYALAFLCTISFGWLTSFFLTPLATHTHLYNSSFGVAHLHYVTLGGTMMAFWAGLTHWWPKITGRLPSPAWSRASALLVFIGIHLMLFPQLIMGLRGMPRRYHGYDGFSLEHQLWFEGLQRLSAHGAVILALGVAVLLGCLIRSLAQGELAPANPWHGGSLEWSAPSPPPPHNFTMQPDVGTGPYDVVDERETLAPSAQQETAQQLSG